MRFPDSAIEITVVGCVVAFGDAALVRAQSGSRSGSEGGSVTTFDERERAFEAKFAHDEELRFFLIARRDRLFSRWAAEKLGLSDQASAELTKSVFALRDGKAHDALLLKDVGQRLSEHGSVVSSSELAAALESCAAQARQQLMGGLASKLDSV